ncbi:elongation factor P [candidate division GN15 bacterium]|uniref:Elongation factor P n=1 Tax=candidate division GN15 bacterium TaxID=2072418 RepID=A0A855X5K6_9BACT|nr:MAG: elongation factor P [candidate division GN15 bacterium]
MYTVSDFRRGLPIVVDDQPYYIVEFQHFKMGRGRANIRTKLKHIKTGAVVEKVFQSSDSFKPPDLENRRMQYLYENTGECTFMDTQTFEQITVPLDSLGDAKWFLLENQEYQVLFLDNNPISVDLPASVVLVVTSTEPVVRGDTVSNVTKPATLQTGLVVKVPPFVKEGDKVKVDTRTSEYLERAN